MRRPDWPRTSRPLTFAAVAVGFWDVEDDRLEMEVLASSAAVEPALQEQFGDGYGYVHIKALVFDVEDDAFRMVQSAGQVLQGWQVDRAARDVIEQAGYGERFIHRTGHSIGQETHGNGANMDDLETHEERRVLRRTCFSVEPGIYLPEFGVRSEVNVFVDAAGAVHVTGGTPQTAVVPIVAYAQ